MRTIFRAVGAFLLSAFAGGMIVQIIAEKTFATEEFILAFMAVPLVAIIVAIAFFIAQLRPNPLGAISSVGRWLVILAVLLAMAVLVLAFWADGFHLPTGKEAWLLVALAVPPIVIVLVHWWFVRWRVGKAPAILGEA